MSRFHPLMRDLISSQACLRGVKEVIMVVLNALFDLNQDVAEGAFKAALDDFCRHLQREGYVLSWRWMQQIQPSGPSFPRPTQRQFVVFEFLDAASEARCYEYVAANREPIRTLHRAMNSKVKRGSAMFFVCMDAHK